jgi:hypothetical protein
MAALRSWLDDGGLLQGVLLSPQIEALLSALQVDAATISGPAGGIQTGVSQLGADSHPLFFDLSLAPFGPPLPFKLTPRADGFDLAFDLGQVPPATRLADMVAAGTGQVLHAATHNGVAGAEEWLVDNGGAVKVVGATLALVIEGRRGSVAGMRLGPSMDQPDGVVKLALDPPTVMLGSSGFGLELPDGFFIDMSSSAAPEQPAMVDGQSIALPGDAPAWKGLSIRNARFYLPESVPLFGRTAVDANVEIGLDPAGIALTADAHVPAQDGRPAMTVHIECVDPTATGIASFVPTLVEVAVELPVDGYQEEVGGAPLRFLASRPLIARARFSREAGGSDTPTRLSIGIESQGDNGILAVSADGGGIAEKGVIAAGAFATALIAEKKLGNDGAGTAAAALITAGMALSSLLNDKGRLVVHGVELATEGKPKGLALTDKQTFTLDYSVDVVIRPIDLAVLSVSLAPDEPLRIRMRGVVLSLDHSKSGLGMIDLDFQHAAMEVEDPGRWLIDGPGSLFDVLGSRTGRGSIWVEVDLRFKLNFGPIRVSGATIRATLDPSTGEIGATLRGLDAQLTLPGIMEGEGKVSVTDSGFTAMIRVDVIPVGFGADAFISLQGQMVLLDLGVDLPGPLPLASSGLGLYGIGGTFGIAASIGKPAQGQDPVDYALHWKPQNDGAFVESPGNFSFGLQAVVGTLADMGFTFSAKAGLFLTVPDFVVLGAIDATILSGRMKMSHEPSAEPLLALRGAIIIDPADAVTFGISGELNIPVLLNARVPAGGHFPIAGDPADWYFYMGADGYSDEGRGLGPASISILPDLIDIGGYGYFMLRGKGITKFPRGESFAQDYQGFVLAFGFGLEIHFGPKPILWAEVSASADLLVATSPLVIAGYGHVEGSVHIGPISVGVSADLEAIIRSSQTSIHAIVCGHVNLVFTKVRKCVELSFGSPPSLVVPPPDSLPLDHVEAGEITGQNAVLIDDKYQLLSALAQSPEDAPTVWPDALISLNFSWPPRLIAGLGGMQFPSVSQYPEGDRARPFGSNLLDYQWELRSLQIYDVTDDEHGPGTPVSGELSAAWQAGRTGAPATSAEPAELILFDIKGTFFIDRMSDAGKSLPDDPISALGSICKPDARARVGWTLGQQAIPQDGVWVLPPEMVSVDPAQSCIRGLLVSAFTYSALPAPVPLDQIGRQLLPPMANYVSARLTSLDPEIGADRSFAGALMLDYATAADDDDTALERLALRFNATIYLDEPIASKGVLFLLLPSAASGRKTLTSIRVYDSRDPSRLWTHKVKDVGGGQTVMIFSAPDGETSALIIEWPAIQQLGFLGLEGITQSAMAAAQARNDAQSAAAATQAQAADDGPLTDTENQSGASRCLLEPGRTYRLDVELGWIGTLYRQLMYGIRAQIATSSSDEDQTLPTSRSYFFRTTPVPPKPQPQSSPAPGGSIMYAQPSSMLVQFGAKDFLYQMHRAEDTFAPELMERHLAGYEPAQSEVARFRHDHLRAHFGVGHVAALAGLYGYDMMLGLRRVDVGDESGDLAVFSPAISASLNPAYLSKTDQRRYQVATGITQTADGASQAADTPPCPNPKPGLTLDIVPDLEPRAWYELYVHLDSTTDDGLAAKLPGVTFQTSRWFAPADMLEELRFGTAAIAATGDLEIHAVSGFPRGPVLDDDSALDEALAHMGLEGWPIAETPRTSLLWLPRGDGTGWDCAGVLIESPEPIHRVGRCTVDSLTAVLNPSQPEVHFDTQFRDRSGSRILFLTSTPFRPASWSDAVHPVFPGSKIPNNFTDFTTVAEAGNRITADMMQQIVEEQTEDSTPQDHTSKITRSAKKTGATVAQLKSQPASGKKVQPQVSVGSIVRPPLGGGIVLPKPVQHHPALRIAMTDYQADGTTAPLTGLLALPPEPLFAGEAQ